MNRRGTWTMLCAAALLLAGPAAAEGKGDGDDSRDTARRKEKPKQKKEQPEAGVTKQGKILLVRGLRGSEPQLTDGEAKRWLIVGDLREETLRLGGHVLKVWATAQRKKKLMLPTLEVQRYVIVDSGGGRKPLVGRLQRAGKKLLLARAEQQDLHIEGSEAFKRRLSARVGCKVWVVGEVDGSTIKAYKFGWVNCNPPKPIKPRKESRR